MGPRVVLPDWLLSMTKWGRETIAGLDDYRVSDHSIKKKLLQPVAYLFPQKYLQEMIDERKALRANGQVPNDILSNIVALNEDHHDGNVMSLSDEEMRGELRRRWLQIVFESRTGTCFALQGAGHETTAHALDLVFRLLALHPGAQEELYRNIQEAKTDGAPLVSATNLSLHRTDWLIDVCRCIQIELCFGGNIRGASHVPDREIFLLNTRLAHLTFYTHSHRPELPIVLQSTIQRWRLSDLTVVKPLYPFRRTLQYPLASSECTMIVREPSQLPNTYLRAHL